MHVPSRPANALARDKRPFRPLPPTPDITQYPYLVEDNVNEPFQLLDTHPLGLICRFHNVKRVSLEDGVPPPFRLDVPVIRSALDNPNALFPTHVLAIYDQDTTPEPSPPLSPYSVSQSHVASNPLSSGTSFSSGPGTPIMVPVNASLWARAFSIQLSNDPVPASPAPSPTLPAIRYPQSHMRDESTTSLSTSSCSSRPGSTSSIASLRPRSVLSLPVHVIRVPSASSLPLLLVACLKIASYNSIAPALLPRTVLSELPAPSAILTEHMLRWLYSKGEGKRSNSDSQAVISLVHLMPPSAISKTDLHNGETQKFSPYSVPAIPEVDSRRFSILSESSVSSLSLPSPTLSVGSLPPSNPNLDIAQNSNRNSYSGPSTNLFRPVSPPPRPRSAGLSPNSPHGQHTSYVVFKQLKQLNMPSSPSPLSPFHSAARQQLDEDHTLSAPDSCFNDYGSSLDNPRRKRQSLYSEINPSVLSDPLMSSDPDYRLLALAQQNFGMWANALSLGARDPEIVGLVDIAWTVVRETRRIRFGVGVGGGGGRLSPGSAGASPARRRSPSGPRADTSTLARLKNQNREQERARVRRDAMVGNRLPIRTSTRA